MKMQNTITGDVLELPPPDSLGQASILLNGHVFETALFSDACGGTVTLGDGRMFKAGDEFANYLVGLIRPRRNR
jgi:hypothetical protein